jgi:hypothetical protein
MESSCANVKRMRLPELVSAVDVQTETRLRVQQMTFLRRGRARNERSPTCFVPATYTASCYPIKVNALRKDELPK